MMGFLGGGLTPDKLLFIEKELNAAPEGIHSAEKAAKAGKGKINDENFVYLPRQQ